MNARKKNMPISTKFRSLNLIFAQRTNAIRAQQFTMFDLIELEEKKGSNYCL